MALLKASNTFFDNFGTTRLQVSVANTLQLYTGNQERFRVDPSGNVGIGTTSPTANLHVIGNITATKGIGGFGVFSVGKATSPNQIVSNDVYTYNQIIFDEESFDTNNWVSGNAFTPQVPGYYCFLGTVGFNTTGANSIVAMIASVYKNGVSSFGNYSIWVHGRVNTGDVYYNTMYLPFSQFFYANGTTDYFTLHAGVGATGGTLTVNGNTYMAGFLVRSGSST